MGSARSNGDTRRLLDSVLAGSPHTFIDLLDWPIAPYNYSEKYPANDAFLYLTDLLLQHPVVVFATPVYWYSMSGVIKIFFDRLTDLTTTHKLLGRQLAGKHVFLGATGSDPELPVGFEAPFRLTTEYFNMQFEGTFYSSTKQPFAQAEAQQFGSRIASVVTGYQFRP
jgi:multimeric flavodoxin WrbA